MSDESPDISVERVESFTARDLAGLCDASENAILEGGGFGWLIPPPRRIMERYWRGVLLVPERELFVGRLAGTIAGSAQLVRPPRNNEAQSFAASTTTHFVAPWARGHGLARMLALAVEDAARDQGFSALNLDVRATQDAAIAAYESLGYVRWGTNPTYAIADGKLIAGYYYTKALATLPEPDGGAS
ncbi:MAG: GNAT family N-acetyltransferase [Defluviicoccus sp.]|nr:GNAT family N-acetyltransferase [Defluviicoccus sp.]MDE0276233.1 GNAT family N-acetyltransferase [Defluviicoccus sp.]